MNREVHVRIWERPEVRVLRATRQIQSNMDRNAIGSSAPIAVIGRVQSPRLLSTLSRPSPSGTQTAKSCGYRTFHGDGATLR